MLSSPGSPGHPAEDAFGEIDAAATENFILLFSEREVNSSRTSLAILHACMEMKQPGRNSPVCSRAFLKLALHKHPQKIAFLRRG